MKWRSPIRQRGNPVSGHTFRYMHSLQCSPVPGTKGRLLPGQTSVLTPTCFSLPGSSSGALPRVALPACWGSTAQGVLLSSDTTLLLRMLPVAFSLASGASDTQEESSWRSLPASWGKLLNQWHTAPAQPLAASSQVI